MRGRRGPIEPLKIRLGRRQVDGPQRVSEVREAEPRRDRRGQHARHALGEAGRRRLHQAAHGAGVHGGRLLVDRDDARQRRRVLVGGELLDLGMDDAARAAAERQVDAPVHHEALPLAEAPPEPPDLVEPDEHQERVGVAQPHLEHRAPVAARARLLHLRDGADGRRLLAGPERAERQERAAVLVAERQVIEEVLDGVEAEAAELLRPLRADAGDGGGRRRERREPLRERVRGRPIRAPFRGRVRRAPEGGEEAMRAAEEPLALGRRAAPKRVDDGAELVEHRPDLRRRSRTRALDALGEGRERQPGLVEAAEAVGREILEGRSEGPEELSEGRRRGGHAGRSRFSSTQRVTAWW
jgi:hypothetical protein